MKYMIVEEFPPCPPPMVLAIVDGPEGLNTEQVLNIALDEGKLELDRFESGKFSRTVYAMPADIESAHRIEIVDVLELAARREADPAKKRVNYLIVEAYPPNRPAKVPASVIGPDGLDTEQVIELALDQGLLDPDEFGDGIFSTHLFAIPLHHSGSYKVKVVDISTIINRRRRAAEEEEEYS